MSELLDSVHTLYFVRRDRNLTPARGKHNEVEFVVRLQILYF